MNIDYLIIGQGVSGTWLSYYLLNAGCTISVIDKENDSSSSMLAAGMINPVTGRRHVTVWMDETLIPFSRQAYALLGKELAINAITEAQILDFFPSAQMRHSFLQRIEEKAPYLSLGTPDHEFASLFNYEFGFGRVSPVFIAHLENILPAWRKNLKEKELLISAYFDPSELVIGGDHIRYRELVAKKIIFCNGIDAASLPFFSKLPFAPNKGELLILKIPGLAKTTIYKRGMVLVPLAQKDLWWLGSSYEWDFDDGLPTERFREEATRLLKTWLKIPFSIIDHLAGIRPATIERRPFVGIHPVYSEIGILNGMGTKGCSLAPWFAKELADNLINNKPILPEADISRFQRILGKK